MEPRVIQQQLHFSAAHKHLNNPTPSVHIGNLALQQELSFVMVAICLRTAILGAWPHQILQVSQQKATPNTSVTQPGLEQASITSDIWVFPAAAVLLV